jgi:hypothetical protein
LLIIGVGCPATRQQPVRTRSSSGASRPFAYLLSTRRPEPVRRYAAGTVHQRGGHVAGSGPAAVRGWNPSYTWTVGGDFNVDPAVLQRRGQFPVGAVVHNSGRATHQSGAELDYFVTSDHTGAANGITAHRMDGANSDHYAVWLGGLRAGAEPPQLKVMPVGDADLSGDGITPNAAGYDKMAAVYGDAIRDALIKDWVSENPACCFKPPTG